MPGHIQVMECVVPRGFLDRTKVIRLFHHLDRDWLNQYKLRLEFPETRTLVREPPLWLLLSSKCASLIDPYLCMLMCMLINDATISDCQIVVWCKGNSGDVTSLFMNQFAINDTRHRLPEPEIALRGTIC